MRASPPSLMESADRVLIIMSGQWAIYFPRYRLNRNGTYLSQDPVK
jgi:hypothetical protein